MEMERYPSGPQDERTDYPRTASRRPYGHVRERRSKKGRVIVIVVVIILIVLVAIMLPPIRLPLVKYLDPTSYREFPQSVEFTLQRHIVIGNVPDHTVDVPMPRNVDPVQSGVSVTSVPSYTTVDKYGSQWMVWSGSGDADITITLHARTETAVWDIKSADVMTLSEASSNDATFNFLVGKYNHKEWKIDPADPSIVPLAEELDVGGTIYDQIKSIFTYLDRNFQYKTTDRGEVKAPEQTLQDGNGDCDDMSFLFIALSRAMGIPSWIELGALYDQMNNEWIGHAWVALYLPMKAGGSGAVNIDVVNREFLVRGANRYTDWSSDGNYTDSDMDGTPDETEWHLYDYYYMYSHGSSPNPYYSDDSVGVEYNPSGSARVRLGGEQGIPGFEALLAIPMFLAAYAVVVLARKNQKR